MSTSVGVLGLLDLVCFFHSSPFKSFFPMLINCFFLDQCGACKCSCPSTISVALVMIIPL